MNSIKCPYCNSAEHHLTDEHCCKCENCHWRFKIDEDGHAVELSPDLPNDPQNFRKS